MSANGLGDELDSTLTQAIQYDGLGRLRQVSRSGNTHLLTYDANGNWTGYDEGTSLRTYQIDTQSNRLLGYISNKVGDAARQYGYDVLGNRVAESASGDERTYEYSPFNRMSAAVVNGVRTEYSVNPLGRRVAKRNGNSASYFDYFGQNQLLAEQDSEGKWADYLWLNGNLVGLVRSGSLYFVRTDHLGRPEKATDAGRAVVWSAYNYAYGRTVVQDVIGGIGLGFPGQYYDQETGLWNNGFRDYDATVGRYIESDPLGVSAGLNTYAYVGGNPIMAVDSLGLKTCLLTTVGPGGVRDHAAVYTSRGDGSGGAALYDPAGSYGAANGGGSSGVVTGDAADIGKFKNFHKGQAVESTCKDTSQKEEVNIINNAMDLPSAAPFECAAMASSALSGQASFPKVEPGTFWPGNLLRQFQKGPGKGR